MKLKYLDKASKIYAEIQSLDKEIISIEKRANDLANGNFEVNVKMTFKNLEPQTEKVKIDSDGSLITGSESRTLFGGFYLTFGEPSKPKESDKDSYEVKIDEKTALYMLGSLLQIKMEQRKHLINKIKELGFE